MTCMSNNLPRGWGWHFAISIFWFKNVGKFPLTWRSFTVKAQCGAVCDWSGKVPSSWQKDPRILWMFFREFLHEEISYGIWLTAACIWGKDRWPGKGQADTYSRRMWLTPQRIKCLIPLQAAKWQRKRRIYFNKDSSKHFYFFKHLSHELGGWFHVPLYDVLSCISTDSFYSSLYCLLEWIADLDFIYWMHLLFLLLW